MTTAHFSQEKGLNDMKQTSKLLIATTTAASLIAGNLIRTTMVNAGNNNGGHGVCSYADVYSINPNSGSYATYTTTVPGKVIVGVCIKAGSDVQGDGHVFYTQNGTVGDSCYVISGLNTTTVEVTKIGSGPTCKDISHLDISLGHPESPTPTPTPTESPTPTVTPTEEPTPTATPSQEVTPTPTDIPEETPTPTQGEVTPTPTDTTEEEVTPTPTPTEAPTPTPTTTDESQSEESSEEETNEVASASDEAAVGGPGLVLGATTDNMAYADTGVFTDILQYAGAMLSGIGAFSLKRRK